VLDLITIPPATGLPDRELVERDYVYEALSHRRRRYLLYAFNEDVEQTIEELSRKVAAWERDVSRETVNATQLDRVYLSLYHTHVPKLVDAGILVYGDSNETVTIGPRFGEFLATLREIGAKFE